MNLTSVSQARPFVASSATRQSAPQEQASNLPGEVFTPSCNEQQPPARPQPPAEQPPTQPTPPQGQQPAPPQQPALKDWTVLVYSVSDNNLYSYLQTDLDEAERVGSTDEMNLIAQTSHQPRGGNVVRMKMEADSTPGLKSPVVQDMGPNYDMATSDNLADTIAWAMKEYPAKHTMVILSDHGGGWKGANHSESTDSWMNITDLEDGFKKAQELTGKKVDVIGFDECLMASTETAHQLKDCADYLVGSEETEGGAGWQYDDALGKKESNNNSRILSPKVLNYAAAALRARDPLTPADMAKAIVTMAEGHQRDLGTMSAIETAKMPALTSAIDNFAQKVIDSGKGKLEFAPIFFKTQKFADFGDMGHFVELAGQQFGGEIGEAADAVKAALGEAVIAEQHSQRYPNAKGLNIELNKKPAFAGEGAELVGDIPNMSREDKDRLSFMPYNNTRWAQETKWDEMVRQVR